MNKPTVFLFALIFIAPSLYSQVTENFEIIMRKAREDVKQLSSRDFHGRGYQKDGHLLAANYISDAFSEMGVLPAVKMDSNNRGYFQTFPMSINLIDSASLRINGKYLELGKDFIPHRSAGGKSVKGKVQKMGHGLPYEYGRYKKRIVLLKSGLPEKVSKKADLEKKYESFSGTLGKINHALRLNAPAVLLTEKKLTAGLSSMPYEIPILQVKESALPKKVKVCEIGIAHRYETLKTQNVIGMIEGKDKSDTCIIISAHYDHLGRIEDAVFTGANDNASGISMLLSLARYFSLEENRPDYSLLFIGFGAEEAGLLGSRYYVESDPVWPLEKTRFVLNLDLMGNGDEGITAVAGAEFPEEFSILKTLNDSLEAVPKIVSGGNRANSDHYFFAIKGIPSLFLFTLGGPPHYHDVYDTYENIKLSKYYEIRELLIDYLKELDN